MLLKKVKVIAGLFVLSMILFASEIPAQIDTVEQDTTTYPDTTIYPDTTTYPDSLDNPDSKQSSVGLENYCEAISSYFIDNSSYILPDRSYLFIRRTKTI